jgi:hypothetical protein
VRAIGAPQIGTIVIMQGKTRAALRWPLTLRVTEYGISASGTVARRH